MYMYMYVKCVHVYVGGLCTECSGFSGVVSGSAAGQRLLPGAAQRSPRLRTARHRRAAALDDRAEQRALHAVLHAARQRQSAAPRRQGAGRVDPPAHRLRPRRARRSRCVSGSVSVSVIVSVSVSVIVSVSVVNVVIQTLM